MFRRGGDRGKRRVRSLERSAGRALHRLPALYIGVLAWAATTVANNMIPVGMVARMMLVIGVAIALYAATAAFVVFLACGRFGIVRRPHWRRRAAAIAIASSFAWILVGAWHEGRTTLNLVAIAAAQLAGIGLYLGRRSVLATARGRLRVGR
jgi:hypothetical protein